ncbi:ParA family protein [Candidatus Electrothrix sp.]|uniref:ParA family protein n=1 Tax=Candidatus Electrothrix sp. TaxID=2170559 RepID=UPI004056E9CD
MSVPIPVLTFFNNKGGVGKTSLIYHLAWMFASLGKRVVIADLDPQANLTAAFLEEEKIEELWEGKLPGSTVYQCVKPIAGVEDIADPILQHITQDLYLIPGDVSLSGFEDTLSNQWPKSMGDNNLYRPMRILSSFWQIMQKAADKVQADIILVDIGPNLGAINQSVLIASDYAIIPLSADLFSLQGLKGLGATLRKWKKQWQERLGNWQENLESSNCPELQLPQGKTEVIGYLCRQSNMYLGKVTRSEATWLDRVATVYREAILNIAVHSDVNDPQEDPYCLASIKHYRSLVPMAQEQRKPIFNLTSADGAIGSHAHAVQAAKKDFQELAEKIAGKIGLSL